MKAEGERYRNKQTNKQKERKKERKKKERMKKEREWMFLTTYSLHFNYGYMDKDH